MEEVGVETIGIYKSENKWSSIRGFSISRLFDEFASKLINSQLRRGAKASYFSESIFMDQYLLDKINNSDTFLYCLLPISRASFPLIFKISLAL